MDLGLGMVHVFRFRFRDGERVQIWVLGWCMSLGLDLGMVDGFRF